jgi:hypothetical protein
MKFPNPSCEILRSLAGLALAGVGLFLLFGRVMGAADRLSRMLEQTASARLEVVSCIMLASSLNLHRLGHSLLNILWPLLPSMVGTVLMWTATSRQARRDREHRPCARWA